MADVGPTGFRKRGNQSPIPRSIQFNPLNPRISQIHGLPGISGMVDAFPLILIHSRKGVLVDKDPTCQVGIHKGIDGIPFMPAPYGAHGAKLIPHYVQGSVSVVFRVDARGGIRAINPDAFRGQLDKASGEAVEGTPINGGEVEGELAR